MRLFVPLAVLAVIPVVLVASQPRRPAPRAAPAATAAPAPAWPLPFTGPPPALPGAKGRVGMNLSGTGAFTTEYPFLDKMHASGGWRQHWGDPDRTLLDAQGWPKRLPADGSQWDMALRLGPKPGSFVLTWAGKGELKVEWVRITGGKDHRVVFVPTETGGGQVHLAIARTDPADPIRDIHVVREDQEALLRAGRIFNPDFIDKLRPFSPIRTMDWSCINANGAKTWAERPHTEAFDWSCVPLEVQVALANELGSDLWLPMPSFADDDYVRQATTYVRDHLAKPLRLQLEYSNEVWNSAFGQHKYAEEQAARLWGGALGPFAANMFYGYRAAQVAAIGREVYGAEAATRLQPILADFTNWFGPEVKAAMLAGIAKAGKGDVGTVFKALAITTYFGDALGVQPFGEADAATVYGWATGGAGGLDPGYQQLEHGKLLRQDFSLDFLQKLYAIHGAWAKAHGLALVAYEGGLSGFWFLAPEQPVNKRAAYVAYITRLKADPRFGPIYARMVRDFAAAGGSNIAVYNDTSVDSAYGPWGTLPDIYATSPGYEALVKAAAR